MDIRITVGNRHLLFLITFTSIILALGITTAYNPGGSGGVPSTMGHSVDEMDWSNPIPSDVSVSGNVQATGLEAGDGSVGSPSITFSNSNNMGFYRAAAATLGASAGGIQAFTFDNTFLYPAGADGNLQLRFRNSAEASPTYTFKGDSNTGMYWSAADEIGFSTGGIERLRIDSTGNVVASGTVCDSVGCIGAGGVGGSGTIDQIPKWTNPTTLGDSVIFETAGGNVGISGLTGCDTIDTDASGILSCGTDDGGGGTPPTLDCVDVSNSVTGGLGWNEVSVTCPAGYIVTGCGDGTVFNGEHWGRYAYVTGNGCTASVFNQGGTSSTYNVYARCCRILGGGDSGGGSCSFGDLQLLSTTGGQASTDGFILVRSTERGKNLYAKIGKTSADTNVQELYDITSNYIDWLRPSLMFTVPKDYYWNLEFGGTLSNLIVYWIPFVCTGGFTPASYNGEESVTFPNGLIIKHGSIAVSVDPVIVTFTEPFPSACLTAQTTNSDELVMEPVAVTGKSKTAIILDRDGGPGSQTVYWLAMGH